MPNQNLEKWLERIVTNCYSENKLIAKVKSKWNSKNLLVEDITYNEDGSLYKKIMFLYNSRNKVIKEIRIDSKLDTVYVLNKRYDTDQNLIKLVWFENNKVDSSIENIFDKGVLVEIKSFFVIDDILYNVRTIRTKFDKQNNWLESVDYDEKQRATKLTERVIEYWD